MITVTVKHENDNRREYGYGIYVNAYVTWDDFEGDIPTLYASECVPFGKNTDENLKAADRRVRRLARAEAKQEYIGG